MLLTVQKLFEFVKNDGADTHWFFLGEAFGQQL